MFTDVEGSTPWLGREPGRHARGAHAHDGLIEDLVVGHKGALVPPRREDDSRFAVFARVAHEHAITESLASSIVQAAGSARRPGDLQQPRRRCGCASHRSAGATSGAPNHAQRE